LWNARKFRTGLRLRCRQQKNRLQANYPIKTPPHIGVGRSHQPGPGSYKGGFSPKLFYNLLGLPLKSKLKAEPVSQAFGFKFNGSYVDAEMKNCRGCACEYDLTGC
jgi:hypothetical protein